MDQDPSHTQGRGYTDLISRRHRLVRMRFTTRSSILYGRQNVRYLTHLGIDIGDLLNSASLSSTAMSRRDDAAISALAELLDELVFGVDLEFGVERGEGTPLHLWLLGPGQMSGREGTDGRWIACCVRATRRISTGQ